MSVTIILILIIGFSFFLDGRKSKFRTDKALYMKSLEWQMMRKKILKRDKYTCQGCGDKTKLEVHHITYKRVGKEDTSDLVSVCRFCHQAIHNKYGYDYSSIFPLIKS